MAEPTSCCLAAGNYCTRCDLLVTLPGLSVTAVARDDAVGSVRTPIMKGLATYPGTDAPSRPTLSTVKSQLPSWTRDFDRGRHGIA